MGLGGARWCQGSRWGVDQLGDNRRCLAGGGREAREEMKSKKYACRRATFLQVVASSMASMLGMLGAGLGCKVVLDERMSGGHMPLQATVATATRRRRRAAQQPTQVATRTLTAKTGLDSTSRARSPALQNRLPKPFPSPSQHFPALTTQRARSGSDPAGLLRQPE
ncbi:hypothetical protein N431DRAFT_443652 [Stipitochalara longipes BDJ]|nr:hypothetical protein N431DRAFT_443652 [Stipitochalara longipes BDJ]